MDIAASMRRCPQSHTRPLAKRQRRALRAPQVTITSDALMPTAPLWLPWLVLAPSQGPEVRFDGTSGTWERSKKWSCRDAAPPLEGTHHARESYRGLLRATLDLSSGVRETG